jgi:ABC transporter substrate binding protein (PQQ-dependent alcohol dehydrogenase system)
VVWVVDSDGEFAAGLPYRTALPRPVVGDAGLVPLAWSPRFERFGAPQVSRRLVKAARRPMTSHDWAAWMAGKALVAAAVAAPKGTAAAFQQALVAAEIDGSKGVAMSFRAWDGQLRQPVLLSDGHSVIATAPADGVLHPKNNLDTLGADAPEKLCKARL